MRAGWGLPSTTAIAAACLMASCFVAGCTPSPEASPGGGVLSGTASPTAAGPYPSGLSPSNPVASPTPSTFTDGSAVSSAPGQSAPASAISPSPSPASTASGPGTGTTSSAPTSPPTPDAAVGPSTAPASSAPYTSAPSAPSTSAPATSQGAAVPAARAAAAQPPADLGPAVYYVAINDGGSRGVRFGCNDSLVAVRGAAVPGDPLTVALGRLLGAGMPLDNDAALYDSLAASSLQFVSGYVSGSTVVVNLTGSLRPGGVCDIPRIEAQLTHTVVSASGATRAEIYINGMTLDVALSLR
ncbi:hypothetical protein ACIPY3_09990 [Paenarthrobacter sp. NPDC089714]|uniref:GerMN domain-containing protein n=1 Tax=Paenarthrobacter sp. NPDC089714 TaxID=3364377 RepID=UPI00380C8AEC